MGLSPETRRLIAHQAGIRVTPSNQGQLAEWVRARCLALSLPHASAYAAWMADPAHLQSEREDLSHLLTSRETYFWRDHGALGVLRQHLLPEVMATRGADHRLRLWSAGCATGEETYTLSVLLQTLLQQQATDGAPWQVAILGTDIDRRALAQARRAVYRPWSFRGCPPEFAARFFEPLGEGLQLRKPFRESVRFETLDLVGDRYPTATQGMGGADIILCRNVFIYLDHAAIGCVLEKLVASLNDGGFLLCAPGELHAHTHPSPHPQLRLRIFPQAVVYQKVSHPNRVWPRAAPIGHAAQPLAVRPVSGLHASPFAERAANPVAPLAPVSQAHDKAQGMAQGMAQFWALANQGDLQAAGVQCEVLLRQSPLSAAVRYLDAVLQLARGHNDKARAALRQVLYLDPQYAQAYALLIEVYRTDHNPAAALQTCRQGLKALATLSGEHKLTHFNAVTVDGFKQFLQGQCDTL